MSEYRSLITGEKLSTTICKNCLSQQMYDTINDDYYCPICEK